MQQPSAAVGAPHSESDSVASGEPSTDQVSTDHSITDHPVSDHPVSEKVEAGRVESVDADPSNVESDGDLDQDLRSLVDGIAMLGRFESELAEFENSLEEVSARGG